MKIIRLGPLSFGWSTKAARVREDSVLECHMEDLAWAAGNETEAALKDWGREASLAHQEVNASKDAIRRFFWDRR